MTVFLRIFDAVLKGAAMIGAALIALTVVTTVGDVIARQIGSKLFYWQVDFVELALMGSAFLIAPWLLSLGAHVRVDVAVTMLPIRMGAALNRIANLLGTLICAVLAVYAWQEVTGSATRGSLMIRSFVIPEWWVLTVAPFAFVTLTVEFALRTLGVRDRRETVGI